MVPQTALQQPLDLELFQGPFDLLLTLVLREEVDLFELPLADLVAAALGPAATERWELEAASELCVILAALAELKARRLLGEAADEEPDEDVAEARERLAARLVAYAPFERAAAWLRDREPDAAGPRYRRIPLPGAIPPPRPPESPAGLAEALGGLLAAAPEPSLAHLTARRVRLPALLARLRHALSAGRAVSFDALSEGRGPLEEAMLLVAALELARRAEVLLSQPVPFGDIAITPARPSGAVAP
jgi:segregation and condensation protein A